MTTLEVHPISTLKQMMTLLQRTYDVIERISSEAGYQVAVDLGWYYVIKMETNIKNEIVPRSREFPRPKSTDDTHFVLDMPYNHEVGPVKEIMIVNFDDTYGLNVRVEISCGKGIDVWVLTCRARVQRARQKAVSVVSVNDGKPPPGKKNPRQPRALRETASCIQNAPGYGFHGRTPQEKS